MATEPNRREGETRRLHPAAYRELQAGEVYQPYVPADAREPR